MQLPLLYTLTLAAVTAASVAGAQILTTGGTAGSSINAGANIGSGNRTGGATVNADAPEAAQIRAKLGVTGQAVARSNTIGQNNNPAVTNDPAVVPAMSGDTGVQNTLNVQTNSRAVRQEMGAATVQDVMPMGASTYTYYPESQVYFAPTSKTYYYSQQGRWYSSTNLPAGVNLGNSRTMQLNGNARVR